MSADTFIKDEVRKEVGRQVPPAVRNELDYRQYKYGPNDQFEVERISRQVADFILHPENFPPETRKYGLKLAIPMPLHRMHSGGDYYSPIGPSYKTVEVRVW